MAKKLEDVVVGMRLPRETVKRADQLIAKLKQTELLAAERVSRSTVLRLAVVRGLDALEREYK
jgi:hypothetical protein